MNHPLPPIVPLKMRMVQLRRRFNLGQTEFAHLIGVHPRTIQHLELGINRRPLPRTIQKMASSLNMSIEDIHQALGLFALSGSRDTTVPVFAVPSSGSAADQSQAPRHSARALRVATLLDNLRPDQQDALEAYALVLHSQRYDVPRSNAL